MIFRSQVFSSVRKSLRVELLGERAGAAGLAPLDHVLHQGDDDARDAQTEVLLERRVLGGEDRLFQERRNGFVGDDLAPLNRELTDDLAVRPIDARDRARRVVVEGRDSREVSGVGEEHAAGEPEHGGHREENHDARAVERSG